MIEFQEILHICSKLEYSVACHNELLSGHDWEGNVVCMNGSFMKEVFLFKGDPGMVGIYPGFTGFNIPEALK